MEIIFNANINLIREKIYECAKFQKVLFLHDDIADMKFLGKTIEEIKFDCIYNVCDCQKAGNEIYNGYKLVIFFCTAQNFLNFDYNDNEFTSIFVPQSSDYLPFLLKGDRQEKSVIFLSESNFDFNMYASEIFQYMWNYFNSLLFMTETTTESFDNIATTRLIVEKYNHNKNNWKFIDFEILTKMKLNYRYLKLIDLIILDAIYCLIEGITNARLGLRDIYKISKNDLSLVDRYYAMIYNEQFFRMVNVNNKALLNVLDICKKIMLSAIWPGEYKLTDVMSVKAEINEFAKNSNGILGYLYLFNVLD